MSDRKLLSARNYPLKSIAGEGHDDSASSSADGSETDVPLQVFVPERTNAGRDLKRPRPEGERKRTAWDRSSDPAEQVTPATVEKKPSYRKLQFADSFQSSSDDEEVAYQARKRHLSVFAPSNDECDDGERAGKPRARPRKFVSPSVLGSSDSDSEMEKAIAASLRDMRSDPRRMGDETKGEAPRDSSDSDSDMEKAIVASLRDMRSDPRRMSDETKSETLKGRRREPEDEAAAELGFLVDSEGSDAEKIPGARRKRRKRRSRIYARERKKWDIDSDDEPGSENDDDDLKVPGRKTSYSDKYTQSDSEDERPRKRRADFVLDSDTEDNSKAEDKATKHLDQIKNRKDAVLQLLLYDAGFTGFNLLPHQFQAVRYVAGLPEHFPYDEEWKEVEDEMSQANEAMDEMLRRDDAGKKARGDALKDAKMIDTMGGICADEMGKFNGRAD